jgi:hypothetical protein
LTLLSLVLDCGGVSPGNTEPTSWGQEAVLLKDQSALEMRHCSGPKRINLFWTVSGYWQFGVSYTRLDRGYQEWLEHGRKQAVHKGP